MHRKLLICCLLLAAVGVAAESAMADPGDGTGSAKPWRIVKTLRYFVDGEVDFESQVYRQGSFLLARSTGSEQAYLLSKKDRQVYGADLDTAFNAGGEPVLDPADLSGLREFGIYEKQDRGRWLVWTVDTIALSVGPKPELIGQVSLAQVLEEKPRYREEADGYVPDPTMVAEIGEAMTGLSFVVGFGTWCPVCASWTPRFIKTLEAAGYAGDSLSFVSTDPEINQPAAALVEYGIDGVPVFIIRRDGKELGRIGLTDLDRDPDDPIESRLARILHGKDS